MTALPPGRLGLASRHRMLHGELVRSPWAAGAGFGLALFCMTLACRAAMLVIALRAGFVEALGPAHLAWLGPALLQDLAAFACTALVVGALLRYLPRRARSGGLVVGYCVLVAGSSIGIASVPLYGALQSTLQWTQLLLAGGLRDLFESALDVVPLPVLSAGFLLLASACLGVPWLAAWALRRALALRSVRARGSLAGAGLGLAVLGVVAPSGGAAGLQVSPVYEFVASIGRYVLRPSSRGTPIDMSRAPHFDRSLIAGKVTASPIESLVAAERLPLSRANVVLIVLESASVHQYGLWGGPPETTPRLHELSSHALIFDDYYTPAPVSMKSLFSMNCSSYPYPHPNAETYVNPGIDCVTISEILKKKGYRTGLFHGGRFSYTQKDAFFESRRYDLMRDAETLVHRAKYGKVPWGADDRAVIDDALEWLEKGDQKAPFFLNLIFLAPHHPYDLRNIPKPFGKKTDLERYRNATLFIDGQIGRVWDFVKKQDKTDDTLFVLVGDHGEAFGEHPGHFTHGTRLYDEAVRTPMMLVNPRVFSGQRTDRVGNHVDLVPTILDLLGLPPEPRHQGKSLLRGYEPHTIHFYGDWHRHYLGLRDGNFKYIYDLDRDSHEIYDLASDRGEQQNLAAHLPKQVAAYKKRVLDWENFYRELIPNYEHYVVQKDVCPGRRECYLDELKPVFQHGVMRRNANAVGYKLEVGKRKYARGLGVTPLSILRYSLRGGGFRRLQGAVGHHVQGGRNPNSSLKVSCEIYLDDVLVWSSGKLAADEPAKSFDLDVSRGSVVELISHDVDGEDWHDWVDWVDVRLLR